MNKRTLAARAAFQQIALLSDKVLQPTADKLADDSCDHFPSLVPSENKVGHLFKLKGEIPRPAFVGKYFNALHAEKKIQQTTI